ncbi:MAG: IclR family transcriptional regulator, partial [Dehalococcoidia bacterium]
MPEPSLNTVHNAIRLLSLFSREQRQLGLTDMAHSLGLTKQSTLRLLNTLAESGLIERVPGQAKYQLGLRLWELGCKAIDRWGQQERLHAILERLVQESGFNAFLTAYSHGNAILIDKVEGSHVIQMSAPLGRRWSTVSMATGRPLLAFQPDDEIDRVLSAEIPRLTDATLTSPDELRQELRQIRREGVAIDRGEWSEHIWAVGAPVFDASARVAFAITASGLAGDVQKAPLEHLVSLVQDAASTLSRALGAPPNAAELY